MAYLITQGEVHTLHLTDFSFIDAHDQNVLTSLTIDVQALRRVLDHELQRKTSTTDYPFPLCGGASC